MPIPCVVVTETGKVTGIPIVNTTWGIPMTPVTESSKLNAMPVVIVTETGKLQAMAVNLVNDDLTAWTP